MEEVSYVCVCVWGLSLGQDLALVPSEILSLLAVCCDVSLSAQPHPT